MPRPPDTTTLASPSSGRALFWSRAARPARRPARRRRRPRRSRPRRPRRRPPTAGTRSGARWRRRRGRRPRPLRWRCRRRPAAGTCSPPATAVMSEAMPAPSSAAARGRMSLPVDVAVPEQRAGARALDRVGQLRRPGLGQRRLQLRVVVDAARASRSLAASAAAAPTPLPITTATSGAAVLLGQRRARRQRRQRRRARRPCRPLRRTRGRRPSDHLRFVVELRAPAPRPTRPSRPPCARGGAS